MKNRLFAFLSLGLLLLAGCATTYRVQVSALNDPALAATQRAYTLRSGLPGVGSNDLEFREVARYVRAALAQRGFTEAADPARADLAIFISYGVGKPVARTYTTATPIYAEVGGGYYTTHEQSTDASGKTTTVSRTAYQPGYYQRVGTDTAVNTVVTYKKYLELSARDNRDPAHAATAREIWTLTAASNDLNADLREALPYLLAAAIPSLGENTHQAIFVEVPVKSPTAQALRTGG